MKINEIELISSQSFPKEGVQIYLNKSTPKGMLDEFTVNYLESGDHRGVILTDAKGDIAAYAGFTVRLNGRVWQAQNAMSYAPYSGQGLVGKIYKAVKEKWNKSIQSDTQQTTDGMKLWTKTLPALGLKPMIFDTETNHIIDPAVTNVDMYPSGSIDKQWRYTWIIEAMDRYPQQNLLSEGSLLMPYRGLWFNGGSSD